MGGALSSLQVDFKRQIQNLIWMEMVRKQTEKKRSEGFLWDFLLGASACFSHYLSPTHPTSLFQKVMEHLTQFPFSPITQLLEDTELKNHSKSRM